MIIDYLDQALGEGTSHNTSKGLQYSYRCPFCNDHKERLFINLGRKVYFCHNCESKGTLVTFISDYASITWQEALNIYREFEGQDEPLPESIEEEVYSRLIKVPDIVIPRFVYPLPEEFTLIEDAKGKAGEQAIRYLKSRGVSMKLAEEKYIGYCAEGKYANRIIMPDFEDGELIYWQARTWLPAPKDKMLKKFYRKSLNPSLSPEQVEEGIKAIDKSDVVGNIDSVIENGMAILVEGKFDEYTIPNVAACLHGKYLSDAQFIKLVRNKDRIDSVALMLDEDAMDKAIDIADRLYRHFDDVLVCKLPKDKDPNELGTRGALEVLREALPYSPLFRVKAKLKGWI